MKVLIVQLGSNWDGEPFYHVDVWSDGDFNDPEGGPEGGMSTWCNPTDEEIAESMMELLSWWPGGVEVSCVVCLGGIVDVVSRVCGTVEDLAEKPLVSLRRLPRHVAYSR